MNRRSFIFALLFAPSVVVRAYIKAEKEAAMIEEYQSALEELRQYPRQLTPWPLDEEVELRAAGWTEMSLSEVTL